MGVVDTTMSGYQSFSVIAPPDNYYQFNSGQHYSSYRYCGAAVVGTTIYFAPDLEPAVGVLDTTTNTFDSISTADAGVTDSYKYLGAVAVGTLVYFAPSLQTDVGVLDTTTNTFSTVATTLTSTTARKYSGAAVVGTKVARRDFAEHFFRSITLHCTATARVLIPAECSAVF